MPPPSFLYSKAMSSHHIYICHYYYYILNLPPCPCFSVVFIPYLFIFSYLYIFSFAHILCFQNHIHIHYIFPSIILVQFSFLVNICLMFVHCCLSVYYAAICHTKRHLALSLFCLYFHYYYTWILFSGETIYYIYILLFQFSYTYSLLSSLLLHGLIILRFSLHCFISFHICLSWHILSYCFIFLLSSHIIHIAVITYIFFSFSSILHICSRRLLFSCLFFLSCQPEMLIVIISLCFATHWLAALLSHHQKFFFSHTHGFPHITYCELLTHGCHTIILGHWLFLSSSFTHNSCFHNFSFC